MQTKTKTTPAFNRRVVFKPLAIGTYQKMNFVVMNNVYCGLDGFGAVAPPQKFGNGQFCPLSVYTSRKPLPAKNMFPPKVNEMLLIRNGRYSTPTLRS